MQVCHQECRRPDEWEDSICLRQPRSRHFYATKVTEHAAGCIFDFVWYNMMLDEPSHKPLYSSYI